MTPDEIKKKLILFLNTATADDIEIDFDMIDIKRVDDGTFKVTFVCGIDEDEDEEEEEEEEDEDFNEEEVEAEESDFED